MNEMRQAAVTRQLGGSTRSRSLWLGVEGLQDAVSGERWSLAEAQQGRAGLDLLLSEHLLLPLVADADLPLDGGDEIRSHAAQLLVHYHGASAQSWPLAPWAEGRGGQRRCGAWAWTSPEPWTALRPLLRSARPASLACLAACRQQEPRWAQAPHAALAWVEGGLLCWMELQAGVLQAARGPRPLLIVAPVQTDKTKESVAEMVKELRDVAGERPIRGEEFASIMRTQTLGLPGRWATLQALENAAIQLLNYRYPDDYFATYARRTRALGEAELAAAAKRFIRPSEVVWVIVGDLAQIEKGVRELNLGEVKRLDADGNVTATN